MQVSRSAYYDWRVGGQKPKQEDVMLKIKVKEIFDKSKNTYGSRRVVKALNKAGHQVSRFKVKNMMNQLQMKVRYPKRFKVTTDSNHQLEIAPNSLNRQFKPDAPNQVWTTDISYVWTLEGWLYLAVVMDLYSRQIVGWAINDNMRTSICIDALKMAFWRKKPSSGLLHHSDRGSQYASTDYRHQLKIMQMNQSMSRKGNCWDNSPTERFFRSLKYEYLNYLRLTSKEMAKLSIVDYLVFYNGQRMHSVLNYKTPLEFENEFYKKTA